MKTGMIITATMAAAAMLFTTATMARDNDRSTSRDRNPVDHTDVDHDFDLDDDFIFGGAPHAEITDVIMAGTGCPAGSAWKKAKLKAGGNLLQLDLSGEPAFASSFSSYRDRRKSCQILVDIEAAPGWTYEVVAIDAETSGYLSSGSTGTARVSAYIQGQRDTLTASKTIRGGGYVDKDVKTYTRTGPTKPCFTDRALNVKSSLSVRTPRTSTRDYYNPGYAILELEKPTNLVLKWSRCRY